MSMFSSKMYHHNASTSMLMKHNASMMSSQYIQPSKMHHYSASMLMKHNASMMSSQHIQPSKAATMMNHSCAGNVSFSDNTFCRDLFSLQNID